MIKNHIKNFDKRAVKLMKFGAVLTAMLCIYADVMYAVGLYINNFECIDIAFEAIKMAPYMAVISFVLAILGDIIIKHDFPEEEK